MAILTTERTAAFIPAESPPEVITASLRGWPPLLAGAYLDEEDLAELSAKVFSARKAGAKGGMVAMLDYVQDGCVSTESPRCASAAD